jgi:hypothetical protein
MHNPRDDTWLGGSTLHRMGLPRRGNPIRKDSHSLCTGMPRSSLCQLGKGGYSQRRCTKRSAVVSHRCRKYLPGLILAHSRRKT